MNDNPCPMHGALVESLEANTLAVAGVAGDVKEILRRLEGFAVASAVQLTEAQQMRRDIDELWSELRTHGASIQELKDLVTKGKGAAWAVRLLYTLLGSAALAFVYEVLK